MPFLTVNDATFYYEDIGSGYPLLFLHGFLGSGRSDTSAELDWLATKYRVIAPDLRGYSQSQPKPRTYPRDFYRRDAEDMKAFCAALGIEKPHVLGFSDGGEVTLCLAEIMPLRSAAEWGAVGYYGPNMRARIESHLPPTWVNDQMRARQGMYWEQMVNDWVRALVEVTETGGDISHNDAHKIDCPVLIMLGTKDTLNPISTAQEFISKLKPGLGRLEIFENIGHAIHEQSPERFRQVLIEHLMQSDQRSG